MNEIALLGRNVKCIREYRNMSLSELAKLSNYDRQALSNLESGEQNIGLKRLITISCSLDIDFPLLFSECILNNINEPFKDDNYFLIFTDNIQVLLDKKYQYQNSIYPITGMDPSYFNRIINHHIVPNLKTVIKIANFFQTDLTNLFTRGGI